MLSRVAFENWGRIGGGKEIDFLFIDADHSYEGVKYDLASWGSLVKKGGIMMAHDYANTLYGELAGVDVAIYETLLRGGWEVIDTCFVSIVCRKL